MTGAYGQNEEVAVRILFLLPEFVIVCCFCMAESPQECGLRQTPPNGEQQALNRWECQERGHEERRLGEFFPAAGGGYSPTLKANLTLPRSISTYACMYRQTYRLVRHSAEEGPQGLDNSMLEKTFMQYTATRYSPWDKSPFQCCCGPKYYFCLRRLCS
jgi:hypothetical protein